MIRGGLTFVLILGLVSLNVLTLTNSRTHDFLYGMIDKLPFPRLKLDSPSKRYSKLAKENNRHLNSLKKQKNQFNKKISKVKGISNKISKRLTLNISRNIAAIPAESLPYIGVASVIAVTIWDIKDACDTMKDLDEMLGFTGIQVDSAETVKNKRATTWLT
jgi:hypothetical protein